MNLNDVKYGRFCRIKIERALSWAVAILLKWKIFTTCERVDIIVDTCQTSFIGLDLV